MSKKKYDSSEELIADVETIDEVEIVESVEIEEEKKEEKFGVVTATMLNVREEPITTSNPLYVLKRGDEVIIDINFINSEWYRICPNTSMAGYVMKKFVKVLEQR